MKKLITDGAGFYVLGIVMGFCNKNHNNARNANLATQNRHIKDI